MPVIVAPSRERLPGPARTYWLHSAAPLLLVGLWMTAWAALVLMTAVQSPWLTPLIVLVAGASCGWIALDAADRWFRRSHDRRVAETGVVSSGRFDYLSLGSHWRVIQLVAPGPFTRGLRSLLIVSAMASLVAGVSGRWGGWPFLCAFGAWIAVLMMRMRGFANSRLCCRDLPFRVGQHFEIDYHFTKRGSPALFDRLTFTLRCVAESRSRRGLRGPEVWSIYEGRVERGDDLPAGPFTVELAFDVPLDAPGVDLGADPPVYWELAIEAEGAGFRYAETYLLPVLGRSPASIASIA